MIRIEATRLIPGRGDPIDDAVVLLDETIAHAGLRADAPVDERVDVPVGARGGMARGPAGGRDVTEVVQVDTVMPGLWDCHVHLFGTHSASPSDMLGEPVADRAARATADRSVMAHCHGTAAMLAAVEAGVRTIEHGSSIDDEVAAAMRERDTLLVPTRLIGCDFLEDAGSLPPELASKMRAVDEDSGERIARAAASGVRIAMGTDVLLSGTDRPAGWGNHGRELSLLVELGLTPLEAIEATTATAPDTLGARAPRSGQVTAGYDADVIAVRGDPTRDIGVLADPAAVTTSGRRGAWSAAARRPVVGGRLAGEGDP